VADVEHLTYGVINPLFATGMAALGDLLGLILATTALARTGRARRRLLVYAALAFGGSGVWVPTMVALLGFSVPPSVLRYAPEPLAVSFGVAILGVGAGLAVACTGRIRFVRLLTGALLIGAAIVGTNVALIGSVRVGGTISLDGNLFAASMATATVTAGITVSLLVTVRRLWVALVAAVLLGMAITATHYLMMAAVQVRLGVEHTRIEGITPILLFAAVILFSTTVLAMLWFFSVGTATRRDLQAIFAHPHRAIDIEPWMIEEVTARIAAVEQQLAPASRQPTPRPTPTISPLWRTVPTAAMATNSRTARADRANARTPVPWVANPPVPIEPAAAARVSTVDDTEVNGLGAALINAARLGEALDRIAQERATADQATGGEPEAVLDAGGPATGDAPVEARPASESSPLPMRKPLPSRKPLPTRNPSPLPSRKASPVAAAEAEPSLAEAAPVSPAVAPAEGAGSVAVARVAVTTQTAVATQSTVTTESTTATQTPVATGAPGAEAAPVEAEPSKGSRWRNRRR
jgi:NO-binding membrane sensor protein with MHYT domain